MAVVKIEFDYKAAQAWLQSIDDGVKAVKTVKKDYVDTISVYVMQDYTQHFLKKEGPEGKWPAWSTFYVEHLKKIGRSGNQLLRFDNRMFNTFKETNYRIKKTEIEFYNDAKTKDGFPYAYAHDNDDAPRTRLPKRQFMWLSDEALSTITKATLFFIEKGMK